MSKEKDIYYLSNIFRESYSINPKKTLRNMEMCLLELGYEVDDMQLKKIRLLLSNDNSLFTVLIILFFLVGLIFSPNPMFFLFGFAFFIAGLLINLGSSKDFSCLIFLFSHGLIGLIILIGSFTVIDGVSFMDENMYKNLAFFVLGIAFCCVGFFRTIIYSVSKDCCKKFLAKSRVFIYFLIGILIIGISSFIFRM